MIILDYRGFTIREEIDGNFTVRDLKKSLERLTTTKNLDNAIEWCDVELNKQAKDWWM